MKHPENTDSKSLITSPLAYLRNNFSKPDDTYSYKTKSLPQVGKYTCNDFGGHNNCTLTATCNISLYYNALGYTHIPSNPFEIYSFVKKHATVLGYNYTKRKGLIVTKNDNLLRRLWHKSFRYPNTHCKSNYLWTDKTAINLIDNGQPFLFSLASGIYFNHTVTVYGYRVYTNNRTGHQYTFLMLADGWSNTTRYMAWTGTGESYVGCMSRISSV